MCGVGAVSVVLDEHVCENSVVDVDKQCVSVSPVLVGVCVFNEESSAVCILAVET